VTAGVETAGFTSVSALPLARRAVAIPLTDPRWLNFVETCPAAGPFHHPAWARLLADCYGYPASALVMQGGAGEVIAGLPILRIGKRWSSLPFTDACPPLRAPAVSDDDLAAALEGARREAGIAALEVRASVEVRDVHRSSNAVIHVVPLEQDSTAVFARFGRSQVQRQIRKAERAELAVTWGSREEDLVDTFYRLHLSTRRRLGVPVQPRRFFRLLWERMFAPGLGFVLLARAGGGAVAGAVFLAWNGRMTYKFGASEPESWKLYPNNLLMWSAIRWGCEHGYHTFDFGRTELDDSGLRRFKSGWGGREEPLVYSTLADRSPRPAAGRLTKTLRPVLRRSPQWVVRAVGETFYRYAA
jgi:CelD/BcsL family acetyltransferase involved in cellulose biosynthesis